MVAPLNRLHNTISHLPIVQGLPSGRNRYLRRIVLPGHVHTLRCRTPDDQRGGMGHRGASPSMAKELAGLARSS